VRALIIDDASPDNSADVAAKIAARDPRVEVVVHPTNKGHIATYCITRALRCSYDAIFDVVVDLRPASPTYRNWESFELRDDEQVTLYVPTRCAHGFEALTEPADVSYMIYRTHDPSEDVSIAFDDPGLAIAWPLPVTIMSPRDRVAPPLAEAARLLA
jgi:dTDP-4-dehydrorhamnose 3,5-epimerase